MSSSLMNHKLRYFLGPLPIGVQRMMETGDQTTKGLNPAQASLYWGLLLEEVAEGMAAIQGGTLTPESKADLQTFIDQLKLHSKRFKEGLHYGGILRADQVELVDAAFDCCVTSLGTLFSIAGDPYGAMHHGAYTNLDKFIDDGHGNLTALKDENGKIKKRYGWTPPDFTPFIDQTPRD